jgi:hypothetical protein
MKLFVVCVAAAWHDGRSRPHRLVKAFAGRPRAEHCRAALDNDFVPPITTNPFRVFQFWQHNMGRLHLTGPVSETTVLAELTSFPDEIFCDWILDCGLTPPARVSHAPPRHSNWKPLTFRNWFRWWQDNAPRMDDYQRRKVRQALDRLHFFEVVEIELET